MEREAWKRAVAAVIRERGERARRGLPNAVDADEWLAQLVEHNALRMRERAAEQCVPGSTRDQIRSLEPELEMPPEQGEAQRPEHE